MTEAAGRPAEPRPAAARGGMVPVAVGLGVFGVANVLFLALVGRDLGPASTAPVSVVWTLVNALGIGLFLPLEQETGRRLSAAAARPHGGADLRRLLRFGGGTLLVLCLVAAVLLRPLADWLLGGRRDLVLVLVLGLAAQALAYFARGVLAGEGRFGRYGAQLGADGALRLVGSAVLLVLGQGTPLTYALVLVAAPLVATVTTVAPRDLLRHVRRRRPGTVAPWTAPLTMLVTASVTGQVLANAGPVAVAALSGPGDEALVGRFVAAVTIARIPLFLFAAVQAVFLPALAALVARRRAARLAATVRRALLATAGLAVTGVVGVAVAGTWALELVYGPDFTLSSLDMTLIAVSGGVYMLSQVLAQALLAHDADALVAAGWVVGLVALLVALALPLDLSTRVALALCAGSVGAVVLHACGLRLVTRRWTAAVPTTSPGRSA